MNDEIEQRLAALRPVDLPPELQARLAGPPAAQLAAGRAMRGKIRWLWAVAPLSAAALWLLAPKVEHPVPHAPPPSVARGPQPSDFHVFLPIKETSTLVRVEDLAMINAGRAHPIRLVRATWMDEVTYAGDDGHSTLHRRMPRAEIVPVSLETY